MNRQNLPGNSWLQKLPDHWAFVPFNALFATRNAPSLRGDEHLTPSQKYGVLSQQKYMNITGGRVELNLKGADQKKHVEPGDVISHLRSFQGGLETSWLSGKVSQAYTVVRPRVDLDSRYYGYLFKSDRYVQALRVTTDQLRDGQSIRFVELRKIPLPKPPVNEQRHIADFLDRETAKIDLLIEKQSALIERLRERRVATVWMHALGQDDRPPFSTSWWGLPPEHWTLDKLGRHARVVNGSTPSRSEPSFWKNGTLPWLNSSYANFDVVRAADQYVTDEAIEKCHLPWLKPGAVLVGITGQGKTRGMVALLDLETTINQHLAGVVPDRSRWDPRYLTHLLRAAYNELRFISEEAGSTKGALTCAALHAFRVPRPPLPEQRSLAEHIDSETDTIDSLIRKTERFIELAKERRAALITAAVTGQIDVTAKGAA